MEINEKRSNRHSQNGYMQLILMVMIMLMVITITMYYGAKFYCLIFEINENKEIEVVDVESQEENEEPQTLLSVGDEEMKALGRLEVLEDIKAYISEGNSTTEMLREFMVDDVVFATGGQLYFSPINDKYKMNDFKQENFVVDERGKLDYVIDEEVKSRRGVDVSSHQGDIDWDKVKNDGMEFALIRVAFRGYGTGKLVVDEKFVENIEGALEAGLDVGVYLFTQAINNKEINEEIDAMLEQIEPYKEDITLPVVLDVEDPGADARYNDLDATTRTDLAIIFLEEMKSQGYDVMIYGNAKTYLYMLEMERIEEYPRWFANYNMDDFYFPYEFEIWQYSHSGSVDGIEGKADLNVWPD